MLKQRPLFWTGTKMNIYKMKQASKDVFREEIDS